MHICQSYLLVLPTAPISPVLPLPCVRIGSGQANRHGGHGEESRREEVALDAVDSRWAVPDAE
eukprot:scaffold3777_cov123-Isochrysis_galbana.AAC.5